jgi:hypothetical protein
MHILRVEQEDCEKEKQEGENNELKKLNLIYALEK